VHILLIQVCCLTVSLPQSKVLTHSYIVWAALLAVKLDMFGATSGRDRAAAW